MHILHCGFGLGPILDTEVLFPVNRGGRGCFQISSIFVANCDYHLEEDVDGNSQFDWEGRVKIRCSPTAAGRRQQGIG